MFARRTFELLGSGTIIISNYSKAYSLLFGDIVISSDNISIIQTRINTILSDDLLMAKLALVGVRKTMYENTYAHRLARITNIIFGTSEYPALPNVVVIFSVQSISEFDSIFNLLLNQSFEDWKAICLVNTEELLLKLSSSPHTSRFKVVLKSKFNRETFVKLSWSARWFSLLNISDYYGPNYLIDLVLATGYSNASAFGKNQFFEVVNGECTLQNSGTAYRAMTFMDIRSSLFSVDLLSELNFPLLFSNDLMPYIEVKDGMSLDYLSYCRNVFNQNIISIEKISRIVDDFNIDKGIDINLLYSKADSLKIEKPFWLGKSGWTPNKLAQIFGDRFTRDITGSLDQFGWHIVSELPDGDVCNLFSEHVVAIEDLGGKFGTPFYLESGVGLQMQFLIRFEGVSGDFIDEAIFELNTQCQLITPVSASHIRFGFRITSSGSSRISRLVLG
jgi:hypothetical protein